MQCPSCDGVLKELKLGKFNVHGCRPCDGFWLKKNEIIPILEYLLDLKTKGKKFKEISSEEMNIYNSMRGRYCPNCNGPTAVYDWGDSGANSFECVRGCGTWLRLSQAGEIVEWWEMNHKSIPVLNSFEPKVQNTKTFSSDSNFAAGMIGMMNDDQKILATPWAAITLVLLNIIFFVISFLIPPYKFLQMLFVPKYFYSNPLEYFYTIFTSTFLHADFFHLFGNMFFLFIFGKSLEDRIGGVKFLAVYLITGFFATLGHAVFTSDPSIPTLGASGAVSGIMGGYLCLFPKAKITMHKLIMLVPIKISLPAWFFLGVWFLGQQLFGVFSGMESIAWFAHLTGFVFGFLILLMFKISNNL